MNSRLALLLPFVIAGCAQMAPKNAAVAEAPPRNADEARAAIARARIALGDPPPAERDANAATSAPGGDNRVETESKVEHPTTVQSAPVTPNGEAVQISGSSREDGCPRRCEASASLRRATTMLCDLVGEEDAECKEARAATQRGELAVATCGCR